ncbi:LysR family transcriptional regulator [Falsiroseomonas selenitidurans]|uniref:LysR family transcriptional regulator n=1 Tax=Falsiroseomonas selenitidurans TaxID=2716335 RepID=A0ABX1EEC9_9PROT|nr:LysR family transcriptional regulator [Falsiroseomonas selenitidurans]NKC33892.1 LysR family transcriptional regulator [Falsiroseomonas selenitidurans]
MAALSDLRLLRNFVLVAEAQSLALAAVRANVSQPALSKQMAALEAELGVRLLDRHARGVRLTEAGDALRAHAGALLRDADRVVAEIGAAASHISGEVALGVVSSLRGFLVAPAVASFVRLHPGVTVRVLEGTSRAMREAVADGRADLAVIATREEASPFALRPFATEKLLAIAPPEARLRLDQPTTLEEVGRHNLVLAAAPNSIRTILDAALSRRGTRAVVRVEVENAATAMDLVRLGVGWSVFTFAAAARRLAEREVSAAPIGSLTIGWALATARERRASAAAAALADAVEQVALGRIRDGHWATARSLSGVAAETHGRDS